MSLPFFSRFQLSGLPFSAHRFFLPFSAFDLTVFSFPFAAFGTLLLPSSANLFPSPLPPPSSLRDTPSSFPLLLLLLLLFPPLHPSIPPAVPPPLWALYSALHRFQVWSSHRFFSVFSSTFSPFSNRVLTVLVFSSRYAPFFPVFCYRFFLSVYNQNKFKYMET